MGLVEAAASKDDEVLGAIAATPPNFDEPTVREFLDRDYGIDGELTPLISERDQNFHVISDGIEPHVVKIAGAAEKPQITDLQIQVLLHLAAANCGVSVPAIRRTSSGDVSSEWSSDAGVHTVRLVNFLPGVPLAGVGVDTALARDLGRSLAKLGQGLADFSHACERRALLWDIQRTSQLGSIVAYIDDDKLRECVSEVLVDYERHIAPHSRSLRRQVIHNDANPGNILVTEDAGSGRCRVSGIIDFGDMVYAPLINDVAVAASYMRAPRGKPLVFILPLIAGYHAITPLQEQELLLLFDLVRARLAATVTILWWRLSSRDPKDSYRLAALRDESDAGHFLSALNALGRDEFNRQLFDHSGV